MSVIQIFDQTAPFVSGYSMRSRYITESLHKLGVDLKIFSSPIFKYDQKEHNFNGVPYSHAEFKGSPFEQKIPLLKEKLTVQTIYDEIDDKWNSDIKLVDAHSSVLNGIAASRLSRKYKVPFLYEIRALWEDAAVDLGKTREGSLRYKFTRFLETNIVNKANKVTVICEGLKKDIMERGIPESKIVVIPNGVDPQKFEPVEADQEVIDQLGLKDFKVIGFIGTFFKFEGLEVLVKAVKQILIRRKDVKLLLVGGGQEEDRLKKQVAELGLSSHVIFTGRVKHDDVKRYYSVMDMLVYPRISKRITELVTPLKPLEAMALEKVVIGSNVGGIEELVNDGKNGVLFEAENMNDLTEKCLYVLDNESVMDKMRKDAREYVLKERNWLTICERYLPVFKELGVKI